MQDKVAGPAIGLMVVAVLTVLMSILSLVMNLLGSGMGAMSGGDEAFAAMFQGGVGVVGSIIAIILAVVIFVGALKMKNLQGYGLAMTAAILAMLPCIFPCCILGLPLGIWALVVLMNEEVKAAFSA